MNTYKKYKKLLDEAVEKLELFDYKAAQDIRRRASPRKRKLYSLPDYLIGLPDTTRLDSNDISKIFSCNKASIGRMSDRLSIPSPEKVPFKKSSCGYKFYWNLGDIKRFISGK